MDLTDDTFDFTGILLFLEYRFNHLKTNVNVSHLVSAIQFLSIYQQINNRLQVGRAVLKSTNKPTNKYWSIIELTVKYSKEVICLGCKLHYFAYQLS